MSTFISSTVPANALVPVTNVMTREIADNNIRQIGENSAAGSRSWYDLWMLVAVTAQQGVYSSADAEHVWNTFRAAGKSTRMSETDDKKDTGAKGRISELKGCILAASKVDFADVLDRLPAVFRTARAGGYTGRFNDTFAKVARAQNTLIKADPKAGPLTNEQIAAIFDVSKPEKEVSELERLQKALEGLEKIEQEFTPSAGLREAKEGLTRRINELTLADLDAKRAELRAKQAEQSKLVKTPKAPKAAKNAA